MSAALAAGNRVSVVDVARTLKPGTVIANFLFEYDCAGPVRLWIDKERHPPVKPA